MTETSHETATAAPGARPPGAGQFAGTFVLVGVCWTLLILVLAGWDYYHARQSALNNARTAARHSYAKYLTFRKWATGHGGVYAPVSPANPPNDYLSHVPERDLTTPSGRPLTLINPAYMLRQIHELADDTFGTRAHITSLRPIRATNAPDPWEAETLAAFERGESERSALLPIDGEPYLRLMRPVLVDSGCLKCHAAQGYRMDDIRGGISVAIPWAPYRAEMRSYLRLHVVGYGGLWFLGMLGIGLSRKRLSDHLRDRDRAEAALRQSEARYQSLFANHHSTMLLIDPETARVIDANPAAQHYYGYSREELRGMPLANINILSPEEIRTEMEKARHRLRNHFEFRHRLANGEARDVEVFSGPVEFDDRPFMYSIIHDITARKEAEIALEQRTRELEERSSELERYNYTVSHDLKSPLVTVKSFLGFLEQDIAAGDAARIGTDIAHMRGAAEKMGRLLDELLEMSRIGRVVNPPEEISFRRLLQEVLSLMAGPLTERGVTIESTEQGPNLFGDRPRLLEIWQNLIENAVKYLGDQDAPRIRLGVEETGGETVFFVRDNGIGIDPRYREKIFGLFEKLDGKSPGSGLGLALVKRIVELYGGRIWVESEGAGKGSCFRFTLPGALHR